MMLQTAQQTAVPFFTNDPAGLFRVFVAFIVGMSPVSLTIVWFLRKGPADAIRAYKTDVDKELLFVKTDITALGRKVDDMGKDMAADRAAMQSLQREIAENQREVIDMLAASAKAITESVHKVDRQVAILSERGDIAECFEKFGTQVEKAIVRMHATNQTRQP